MQVAMAAHQMLNALPLMKFKPRKYRRVGRR